MRKTLYPDSGSPYEDAAVLQNAAQFSTATRAHSAQLILQQSLDVSSKHELSFLTIEAFMEFMTSTEDMLGWLFTLQEWQPGNAEFSLLLLLNRIEVGRKNKKLGVDYTEARAVSLLSNLNGQSFRELIHIPNQDDLIASGISTDLAETIKNSLPLKLEGWHQMASKRAEQDRGWVHAFNKLKHQMLAFPTQEHNKDEVWLPSHITFQKKTNRILLEKAWLEVNINRVRRWAGDAIGAQAVLQDTLALILLTRYGIKFDVPQWVIKAYETDYIWKQ